MQDLLLVSAPQGHFAQPYFLDGRVFVFSWKWHIIISLESAKTLDRFAVKSIFLLLVIEAEALFIRTVQQAVAWLAFLHQI